MQMQLSFESEKIKIVWRMAILAKSYYGSSPLCVHLKIPQKKTIV